VSAGPDREVVELLRDDPDLLAIADAVVATQPPTRTSYGWRLLAVAAVVGAVVVLGMVAPWHGRGQGLVGRALAAVGQGPVLHVMIASHVPNETIVTLSSGRERPVPQTIEYWYDADRRLLRAITSTNGGVVVDALVPRDRTEPLLDPALTAFVSRYRARFGEGAAITAGAEAAYFQVHLFAQAARRAADDSVQALREALAGARFDAPQGTVRIDPQTQHTWLWPRIARLDDRRQFQLVLESAEAVPPSPYMVDYQMDAQP